VPSSTRENLPSTGVDLMASLESRLAASIENDAPLSSSDQKIDEILDDLIGDHDIESLFREGGAIQISLSY
jgi:hypothetical protein